MATSRLRQEVGLAGGGPTARRFERAITELQPSSRSSKRASRMPIAGAMLMCMTSSCGAFPMCPKQRVASAPIRRWTRCCCAICEMCGLPRSRRATPVWLGRMGVGSLDGALGRARGDSARCTGGWLPGPLSGHSDIGSRPATSIIRRSRIWQRNFWQARSLGSGVVAGHRTGDPHSFGQLGGQCGGAGHYAHLIAGL